MANDFPGYMRIDNDLFPLPTDKLWPAGSYVDLSLPNKIRKFAETFCIQSKAPFAGQPLRLTIPWQVALLNSLYGPRRESGELLRRRASIWVSKKAGKSSMLAALCLYHLISGEGSEVYAISATVKQADIIFQQACQFIERHPALSQRLWVRGHIKTIEDRKTQSVFKVLSSDKRVSGFNANYIAVDELAEFPSHGQEVWDRIQDAGMARKDSLICSISTAQFDRSSLGYTEYNKARKILTGESDDYTCLPCIYEVTGDNNEWRDPDRWWPALPSLGYIVDKDYYLDAYNRAKDSAVECVRMQTLLLNRWVGSSTEWLQPAAWDRCKDPSPESAYYGRTCILAVDASKSQDLSAIQVLIPDGDKVRCFGRYFLPRDTAYKRAKEDNTHYHIWGNDENSAKTGMILTDGDDIDPSRIRQEIKHLASLFDVQAIYFDPYNFNESRQLLEADGFNCVEVKQNAYIMAPCWKHLETLVIHDRLRHPDNCVLNWAVGNCTPRIDDQDRMMINKSSATQRIDPVAAIAIGCAYFLEEKEHDVVLKPGEKWLEVW